MKLGGRARVSNPAVKAKAWMELEWQPNNVWLGNQGTKKQESSESLGTILYSSLQGIWETCVSL